MNLLVVEDDPALSYCMVRRLTAEGHSCAAAFDGVDALRKVHDESYDMLVLDLNLPELDGMEVLTEVRAAGDRTAVMVVTGRAGLEERVRCLEKGADDVLLKPFALSELCARVRAVERRAERAAGSVLHYADLELDCMHRTVRRNGEPVELTAKEFALLLCLMQHEGRSVPRATLLEQVWQMPAEAETNVVDVYINYLRRKLEAGRATPLIETVRGIGYRLAQQPAAAKVCKVTPLTPRPACNVAVLSA